MNKKQERINKEIEIWENRVFYPNEKFKENTTANLSLLKNKIKESKYDFVVISSETEGVVYKIGRFLIENEIPNNYITFQDGEMIEPYIDINAKYEYQSRDLIDEFMSLIENDIKGKWVLIPELNCQWNKKMAMYFLNKFKKAGAYAVVFYCNKNEPDTLSQIICQETYYNITQFPKNIYKPKKNIKILEDDNY